MPQLMIGVSGVRGVYGDGLSDDIARRLASAFGSLRGGPVVIGRDSRVSGPAIAQAVIEGLTASGADVIDLGLATTPTVEMAVVVRNAAGGIIISASHNPREWNGLKFLGPDGVFLTAEEGADLVAAYEAGAPSHAPDRTGTVSRWDGADAHHLQAIRALPIIGAERIVKRHFTVAYDAVNGVGGSIGLALLDLLGCTVHAINTEPTGIFPHGAEPIPENLGDLGRLVCESGADIGFAVDPDVDRLSLVDEHGTPLGEEYTLALAADYLMSHGVSAMACNLSTSRMIDDVAALHGGHVHRSAVGEINVVQVMRAAGAGAGGEGNGGVIYPPLHPGRDAVLGMALILAFLAERGEPLSALAAAIPHYVMLKDKTPVRERGIWRAPVLAAFPDAMVDQRDGLKLSFPDSWVHVRESNTEPVVRVIAEAPDREKAESLIKKVYDAIG